MEYTKGIPTSETFREMSAVVALCGAMERRIWVCTAGSYLFANLYVLLVAPPGIGKTVAISRVHELWTAVQGLHVAPKSLTRAALVDCLGRATRVVDVDPREVPLQYHTLLLASPEWGLLVPAFDNDFMNHLNDFYDCGASFEEARRHSEQQLKFIENPQLVMLGGTQPAYLADILPEVAFQMGFMSRVMMVYSGTPPRLDLFNVAPPNNELMVDLVNDLTIITWLWGEMQWKPDAAKTMQDWVWAGCPPVPQHPKLVHYAARRVIMAIKLSMILSVDRSNDLIIERSDVDRALKLLFSIEDFMPEVFKEMSVGPHSIIMEEAWQFMNAQWIKNGRQPVPEVHLINFVMRRVPTRDVMNLIEMMIHSGLLRVMETGDVGRRKLEPSMKV